MRTIGFQTSLPLLVSLSMLSVLLVYSLKYYSIPQTKNRYMYCRGFPPFLKAKAGIYITAQNTEPTNYYQFSLRKVTVSENSWFSISLKRQLLLKQPSHFFIFLKVYNDNVPYKSQSHLHNHHNKG